LRKEKDLKHFDANGLQSMLNSNALGCAQFVGSPSMAHLTAASVDAQSNQFDSDDSDEEVDCCENNESNDHVTPPKRQRKNSTSIASTKNDGLLKETMNSIKNESNIDNRLSDKGSDRCESYESASNPSSVLQFIAPNQSIPKLNQFDCFWAKHALQNPSSLAFPFRYPLLNPLARDRTISLSNNQSNSANQSSNAFRLGNLTLPMFIPPHLAAAYSANFKGKFIFDRK
jgi:hypothetical protein